MRHQTTKITALALAALLTLSPAASASQALGTEIHAGTSHLAQGVDYTRQYLWSATYSDLRTESYFEYTPNDLVQPAVAYGDTVLSKNKLSALAQELESEGMRVLGGVNGDYYVVATGAPLGMVVTDGVVRSSSSYHYALGFDADGNAFIGQPELSITATFHGTTYEIAGGLNKVRTANGGYVLYTSDFSSTTQNSEPGIDVILTPSTRRLGQTTKVDLDVEDGGGTYNPITGLFESFTGSADLDAEDVLGRGEAVDEVRDTLVYTDVPTIGGRMSCTVEQVLHSEKDIEIPQGSLVLSINSKDSALLIQALEALESGDTVDIDITCDDARWKSAVTAVGGLYKMVTGGAVESGLETTQAPRTAVGIKADGTVIFYTVDGRQSGYSVGASMAQVAQRLVELGCVEAMCLDGGGSTTLGGTQAGGEGFSVWSKPSDGTERAVSNALFLVADQAAVGRAEQLAVEPGDALLLSGAQLELSAVSTDKLGQAVRQYEGSQLSFDLSAAAGSIDQSGVLTAGTTAGTYTLTARTGSLTGSAQITVVTQPDAIKLRDGETGAALTHIYASPNEVIDLSAAATFRNLTLTCQDEQFTWSVSAGAGTIDQSGVLTAGPENGSGTVTVRCGQVSVDIPLTISSHVTAIEDFEGSLDLVAGSDTASIRTETRPAYVARGGSSAVITYSMGALTANINTAWTLPEGEPYLSLWVYGNGSGNILSATVQNTDGTAISMPLTTLSFSGWQRVTITLPALAKRITQLTIDSTGGSTQGTIWLDHVTTSNQLTPDTSAPTISATLNGSTLTAVLQDDLGGGFTAGQVSVTYDGREQNFTLNGSTVTAILPEQDGLAHRVTVTAADTSGNLGRASLDIPADAGRTSPFTDMSGHWAESYVNYLYDQGITNGVASGDAYLFQPSKNITRGEFALMISRWMRLDLNAYSGVTLPFADTAAIPSWCLDAVKAMYALGIMQGSNERGVYYAFATQTISRAEALTMLGRIQGKGYAAADLSVYSDAVSIPSWAAEHIASMAAQGVISGRPDGTLAPMTAVTRCEIAKILYAMR